MKVTQPKLKTLYGVFAITALALTTGCSSKLSGQSYSTAQVADMSPLAIVSQESQKALNAQKLLVKYKQAQNNRLAIQQLNFDTDKIVYDYIGKPQPLLSSMSIKYGYRFLEVCPFKELPTVNFTNYYTTPNDALIFLDSQLGDEAQILIDKQNKTLTLSYCANHNPS